jgi:Phycobilisome degradation protein nblA
MTTQSPEPNQPPSTNLTMEQEFSVVNFGKIAESASKEQLLGLYIQLLRSYYSQRNYYEYMVKQSWGIDEPYKRPTEEERRS